MIRELLVGGAVLGGGGYYVASNYMSADVVRTVKATPHDTWRGFNLLLNDYSQGMAEMSMMEAPGTAPRVKPVVTSVDSKEIDFRLVRESAEVVRIHVRFEPLAGGAETKLMIDADISKDALPEGRPMLGGNLMFRQALTQLVDKVAVEIESGKLVQAAEAFAEMRRRIATNPRMGEAKLQIEEYHRREAQAAAARPMLDPNAERVNPVGVAVRPVNPNAPN